MLPAYIKKRLTAKTAIYRQVTLQERPSARSNLVSITQYILKASKLTNYQVISLFISWLRSRTTLLTVNMLNAVKRQRIRSMQELPKLTCLLLALWTWRGRSAMAAYRVSHRLSDTINSRTRLRSPCNT